MKVVIKSRELAIREWCLDMHPMNQIITCLWHWKFLTYLVEELARIRKEGKVMKYLRPDAKSQVTIEYDESIVHWWHYRSFYSAWRPFWSLLPAEKQAMESQMQVKIKEDILKYLVPAVKKRLRKEYTSSSTEKLNTISILQGIYHRRATWWFWPYR